MRIITVSVLDQRRNSGDRAHRSAIRIRFLHNDLAIDIARLSFINAIVVPLSSHQLVMIPDLDDPTAVHNAETISLTQSRETMSDGDHRSPLHEIIERPLDLFLGLKGCLIEYEDGV